MKIRYETVPEFKLDKVGLLSVISIYSEEMHETNIQTAMLTLWRTILGVDEGH
jgi:hypothetical protein